MSALTRYEMWYGRNERPIETYDVQAGPMTAQLEGADLRYVRVNNVELVRRLYVAVRDVNWATVPGTMSNVNIERAIDHFLVTFTMRHTQPSLDFSWDAEIRGMPDGTISYHLRGMAESDFRYNRIGLCLLHPPHECADRPYRGETPTGSIMGALPSRIAPQRMAGGTYLPLFPSVSNLMIDLAGDVTVQFEFEGDLFEMEDQRNWTDNSFKTYSTPLALPWPRDVHKGAAIQQHVTMSIDGAPSIVRSREDPLTVSLGETSGHTLPSIGLGVSSGGGPLSSHEVELLHALHPDHLRVDIDLGDADYAHALEGALADCAALSCGLHLALFLDDDPLAELQRLAALLGNRARITRVLVFNKLEEATGGETVQMVRERLRDVAPSVFAIGTTGNFAELNTIRPDAGPDDGVVYSLTPQVHAFDEQSIVETLEVQAETVRTARSLYGPRPIIISPITLKPRSTSPSKVGVLPPSVDPRQMSLFAAAWTIGSIKYLAQGGADSLTYYETTGWRGVMELADGPGLPAHFRSLPGMVFPIYHVLADVAEFTGAVVLPTDSSRPLRVDGLTLGQGRQVRTLLANMCPVSCEARVLNVPGTHARIRHLDERCFSRATSDSDAYRREPGEVYPIADGSLMVSLLPYSITCIDCERNGGADTF